MSIVKGLLFYLKREKFFSLGEAYSLVCVFVVLSGDQGQPFSIYLQKCYKMLFEN